MEVFNAIIYSIKAIRNHPKFLIPTIIMLAIGIIAMIVFVAIILTSPLLLHKIVTLSASTSVLPSVIRDLIPTLAIFFIIVFLLGAFVQGVYVMLCSKWRSNQASISWAFRSTSGRYVDLLLFNIIVFVIFAIIAAVFLLPLVYVGYNSIMVPIAVGARPSPAPVIGFMLLALVLLLLFAIAAVVVSVLLFVSLPLILLKDMGPVQALKRSYAIGRENFADILVLLIANGLLIFAIEIVGSLFQIIPIVGLVIYILISIFVSAYSQMVPTMYFIEVHKKKK